MKKSDIKEKKPINRLRDFVKWTKENKLIKNEEDFETRCGMGLRYIRVMEARVGDVGSGIMAKVYAEFPMLNLHWLVTGEGKMLKPKYGYEQGYNEMKRLATDMYNLMRKMERELRKEDDKDDIE